MSHNGKLIVDRVRIVYNILRGLRLECDILGILF